MAQKRLCMVVHAYFPDDPRVRREALAAKDAGYDIDVFCLRQPGEERRDSFRGLNIYRLPVKRRRTGGRWAHIAEYLAFFLAAFATLTREHFKKRYSLVQVHNLPDFLVFAAVVPKILGAVVWLDLHELTPELYQTKYDLDQGARLMSALKRVERASIGFAHQVLVSSEPFRDRLLSRGIPADKVTVVINSPDFNRPDNEVRDIDNGADSDTPFTLVYHGTLAARYGLDDAVQAVDILRHKIPNIKLDIYGRGEAEEELRALVGRLGLTGNVRFLGYREMSELLGLISTADVGLVPLRATEHNNLALPTKLFDYVLLNVPVVASRTRPVAELFSESAIAYFTPGNASEMADRIYELYQNPPECKAKSTIAAGEYLKYDWRTVKDTYVGLLHRN